MRTAGSSGGGGARLVALGLGYRPAAGQLGMRELPRLGHARGDLDKALADPCSDGG